MQKDANPETEWVISAIIKRFVSPQRLSLQILRNITLWILICGALFAILWSIDYMDYLNTERSDVYERTTQYGLPPYTYTSTVTVYPTYQPSYWVVVSSIVVFVVGFNIAGADIVYHHARRHKRKALAWATAFILFSPLLTGIVYFLTWPVTTNRS